MVIWPVALSRGLMPSLVHLNHGIAGVASVLFAIPLARCGMARAVVWQARMASAGVLAEQFTKNWYRFVNQLRVLRVILVYN